ncbi:enoyl-CoA hydratase/isomerase family protein [Streptomyces noursei]|uniref:enoyl-CoA hydratase/isomerase family protein n=1 Tax=Streptomyces noursei TaxID=1971 RepID=UPI0023B8245E|nr:enoyl-CoA hydratase/isomerase family protein [Streptomyces noursei]
MTGSDDPVLLTQEGRTARITLNRPRAVNALTHPMVDRIDAALTACEADPAVAAVVLTGAGERGLCAGGDIRAIYEDARARGTASAAFWRAEYRLNARIARYPKPYVAVMDGIVMGGGVGLSAHGNVRLVTERSQVAMPETGIGFVPDVGGTYLLGLAPGELGTHLALTGTAIGAADPDLLADLTTTEVWDALERHVRQPPPGELARQRPWIDSCYRADTVEEIVDRLRAHPAPAAARAAETLSRKSPTALKVTLAAVRRARHLGPLERVLEQEYRISCAALSSPDLVEGIRAQVIDKDRTPKWSPGTLAEVGAADVERFFASPEPPGPDAPFGPAPRATAQEVPW